MSTVAETVLDVEHACCGVLFTDVGIEEPLQRTATFVFAYDVETSEEIELCDELCERLLVRGAEAARDLAEGE